MAEIFEHDYESEPIDLISGAFIIMKELHQSYRDVLNMTKDERNTFISICQEVNKHDDG